MPFSLLTLTSAYCSSDLHLAPTVGTRSSVTTAALADACGLSIYWCISNLQKAKNAFLQGFVLIFNISMSYGYFIHFFTNMFVRRL